MRDENQQRASKAIAPQNQIPKSTSETVTVHFPFNSSQFKPTADQQTTLASLVENAHHIEVRGRTDAQRPSFGDEVTALKRAQAAMKYLVAHGVPASKISVNYLSGGDHIAFNRAKNRRVEIEVFSQ